MDTSSFYKLPGLQGKPIIEIGTGEQEEMDSQIFWDHVKSLKGTINSVYIFTRENITNWVVSTLSLGKSTLAIYGCENWTMKW